MSLWVHVVSLTASSPSAQQGGSRAVRYCVCTREQLDLDSPTAVRDVFHVNQSAVPYRVRSLHERQAAFTATQLEVMHAYTRRLDKECIDGGPQAPNSSDLDNTPLTRQTLIGNHATQDTATATATSEGQDEESIRRELGVEEEEVPGRLGAEAMAEWLWQRVDRHAMDALTGAGIRQGGTLT